VQKLLTALRAASKSTLAVVSLALFGMAAVGAYVAVAATKVSKPAITAGPANPTKQTSAAFTYTSKTSVTFLCSLDGGPAAACGSGTGGSRTYAGPLGSGTHTFSVVALSGTSSSDPAAWTWTIDTAPPPAPAITSHPDDPTPATSAHFAHSDSESGVSYQCSLDGGAFSACGAGKDYSGLGLGAHTHRVQAVDKAGNVSGTTVFSWTIVAPPPPKPKITSGPASLTKQTAATFTYTDTSSVTFMCSYDGGAFFACGTGTSASHANPGPLADGTHTFQVKAKQGASAMSDADSRTWTVDTAAPLAPTFTQKPTNPTTDKKATLAFTDAESGVTFQCKLDAAAPASCGGSVKYNNLTQGSHTFCVQALDKAGNGSTAACYTWQIGPGAVPFTIAGSPLSGSLLYPGGAAVAINLVFTNPNGSPITIQSASVTVSGTSAPGCAAGNFAVTQQLTATPTVPANSTTSLQALGVAQSQWPQLQMIGSGNQNSCQNATVNLAYTGTATG
jgi:large repetitive protein